MKFGNSIVNRISVWFVAYASILAGICIFLFYLSLQSNLRSKDRDVISERLDTLQSILERKQDPLPSAKRRIESEWASISFERLYVRLRTPDGKILSISPDTPALILDQVFSDSLRTDKPVIRSTSPEGKTYLVSSRTFRLGESEVLGDLALDLSQEETVLRQLRIRIIGIVIFALLVSLIFGRKLAVSSLRPVQKIADRASYIRSSNLHERLETTDLPLELQLLVTTFNEMLDRLSDSFERLSQFSSDIAHELRTPVNNIRGEIEVILNRTRSPKDYQEVLSSSLEELDRNTKITDGLLFLAKSENPESVPKQDLIDLGEELKKISEFYESTATEAEIAIEVSVPGKISLSVNRILFQRAIGNLISNAIAHTPPNGLIQLAGKKALNFIEIQVVDTGEGIPAEHLTKIFDRFYRADPSRSVTGQVGFGLGLAIVKGIVKLHAGHVEAQSTVGKGTRISLFFPHHS
jgi:two-component system heavy metal sensor histidine kinase CusS